MSVVLMPFICQSSFPGKINTKAEHYLRSLYVCVSPMEPLRSVESLMSKSTWITGRELSVLQDLLCSRAIILKAATDTLLNPMQRRAFDETDMLEVPQNDLPGLRLWASLKSSVSHLKSKVSILLTCPATGNT